MTKDPNFVSVRLPDDVANWLRAYATNNNMVRANKPNMGGSIIAIIRTAMSGQTISNNVGQSSTASDTADIESMINDAIANLRSSIDSELRDIKHDLSGLKVERLSENTDTLVIQNLQTNLTIAQNRIDELSKKIEGEATAPAQKAPVLSDKSESISSLESESLPTAIENTAAATDSTKPSKRSPKPKYSHDKLATMTTADLRKIYRDVVPYNDRKIKKQTKAEYATKEFMIEAILQA